jgi:hypothetical protein
MVDAARCRVEDEVSGKQRFPGGDRWAATYCSSEVRGNVLPAAL